jgi:rare lipoprotein A
MKHILTLLIIFQVGIASWYGLHDGCSGNRMANGQRMNPAVITVASNTFPLGAVVEIENLDNGLKVVCPVTDTGGFSRLGRVADLSFGAACELAGESCRRRSLCSRGLKGLFRVSIRRVR